MRARKNLGPRGTPWTNQKMQHRLPMRMAHLNVRKNLDATIALPVRQRIIRSYASGKSIRDSAEVVVVLWWRFGAYVISARCGEPWIHRSIHAALKRCRGPRASGSCNNRSAASPMRPWPGWYVLGSSVKGFLDESASALFGPARIKNFAARLAFLQKRRKPQENIAFI